MRTAREGTRADGFWPTMLYELAAAVAMIAELAGALAYWLRIGAAHALAVLRRTRRSPVRATLAFLLLGFFATAFAAPTLARALGPGRCSQEMFAQLDLKAIESGIELYRREQGALPQSLTDLVPRYVKELHRDPWGADYSYQVESRGYQLCARTDKSFCKRILMD